MKIKVHPEDFQVTERLDLPISSTGGTYAIYRLKKRGWNTVMLTCSRSYSDENMPIAPSA